MGKIEYEAECVGCGSPATHYCEGIITSYMKSTKHGSFHFSTTCGYPVCSTCIHIGYKQHQRW